MKFHNTNHQNTWEWKGEETKILTVKSTYNIIQNNFYREQIDFSQQFEN